jgi:hypothetical protein
MGIDFSALCLGPAMAVFGREVTIVPIKSQPQAGLYLACGIYTEQPVDIPTEDGSILSSTNITLGIRLSEFEVVPVPGDRVRIDGQQFIIDDTDDDGQGGSVLSLKKTSQ